MPGKSCGAKGHRKHTPITSKKEQRFFGAEYGRKKAGKSGKTQMSRATLKRHLEESKGKHLPARAKKPSTTRKKR